MTKMIHHVCGCKCGYVTIVLAFESTYDTFEVLAKHLSGLLQEDLRFGIR